MMEVARRKGYGRVSSDGQERNGNSLEDQHQKLMDAGCAEEDIVLETYTGTKVDRPKFTKLVKELEPGDTLVVCKLDRFARTASEGSELVKSLLSRGVNVHVLNMGLIENTPTGRLILNVLLSFAEFERDMIVERTSEGKAIKRATDPDFKEGRPRKEIPAEFFKLLDSDISIADACKVLGIHRTQWYRWKKAAEL